MDSRNTATGPTLQSYQALGPRTIVSTALLYLLILVCLAAATQTHKIFEVQGDDGIELAKAQLVVEHPGLVYKVWNDQPWFLSRIYAVFLKLFGYSPVPIRLLTMLASSVGLASILLLTDARSWGLRIGVITAYLLFPSIAVLSLSAMVEVTVISLAALGNALLMRCKITVPLIILCSVIIGLSLTMKFTALLFVPSALGIVISDVRRNLTTSVAYAVLLVADVTFVPLVCEFAWNPRFLFQVIGVHSEARLRMDDVGLQFGLRHAVPLTGMVILSVVNGIRYWRSIEVGLRVYTVAAVMATFAEAALHRPWWPSYYTHIGFALIPFFMRTAWLAWKNAPQDMLAMPILFSLRLLMLSLAVTAQSMYVFQEVRGLTGRLLIQNAILESISHLSRAGDTVYSCNAAFPFYGHLSQIPDLTVVTLKRVATGNITDQQVCEVVERQYPSFVILSTVTQLDKNYWQQLVDSKYRRVAEIKGYCLFAKPDRVAPGADTSYQFLRSVVE
jgi:hypothetical protein